MLQLLNFHPNGFNCPSETILCFSTNPVIELIQKQGSKTGHWTPTLLTTRQKETVPLGEFHCPAGIKVQFLPFWRVQYWVNSIHILLYPSLLLLLSVLYTPFDDAEGRRAVFTRVHGCVNIARLCSRAHASKAWLQVTILPAITLPISP